MIGKTLIVLTLISVVQSVCGAEICYCPTQNSPVCGINNVTYLNTCFALKIYAVSVACEHRCPCKPGVLINETFYNINEVEKSNLSILQLACTG